MAVSNSALNLTSAPVRINVAQASFPILTQDISPLSTNEYAGQNITYAVAFDGSHPITNQWQFSSNNGATFQNISGATNSTLTLTDLQSTNSGRISVRRLKRGWLCHQFLPQSADEQSLPAPAESIAWGSVVGITGDNNLLTNGIYFDALLDNTGAGGALVADGITFNAVTSSSSTGGTDGKITFTITSGDNNSYSFTSFPSTLSPSSSRLSPRL